MCMAFGFCLLDYDEYNSWIILLLLSRIVAEIIHGLHIQQYIQLIINGQMLQMLQILQINQHNNHIQYNL